MATEKQIKVIHEMVEKLDKRQASVIVAALCAFLPRSKDEGDSSPSNNKESSFKPAQLSKLDVLVYIKELIHADKREPKHKLVVEALNIVDNEVYKHVKYEEMLDQMALEDKDWSSNGVTGVDYND